MKPDIQKKIKELEKIVSYHQRLYYQENRNEISDKKFDALFKELQALEAEYPEFASENSPTKTVGSDLDNKFTKFTHKIPVLSLENTYNSDELLEWLTKTGLDEDYSVEWKIDGASIVLYYENGELKNGVTRGTGGTGDDVTENIRTIRNVPLQLSEPISIYVRGEVFMSFKDFDSYNEESDSKYANPRNLAAGSIKNKFSSETAKRPLQIYTYDAYFPDGQKKIRNHSEILTFLKKLYLPLAPDSVTAKGSAIPKIIEKFKKKKDKSGFPVDGLVIKLNSLSKREALGFTTHSPRWARAFKFDAETKESKIINIDYAVGRTGKITPRAQVEPVQLAGTTVSYATLHNQDYINELGVGIGAIVRIAKRGEIIPAVEEVVTPGKEIFQIPANCPSCGTITLKLDDSVDFFCPNRHCPEREINGIIFFCQKKQMDIDGLGEKQVTYLYKNGFIKTVADLYTLHRRKEELSEKEGFGEKSVGIILNGIEESRKKDFRYILPSLGFSEIGHRTTELLIENGFDSVEKLIAVVKTPDAQTELENLHGIGPRTAISIIQSFKDKENLKLIKSLQKLGLVLAAKKKIKSEFQPFAGQSWCVTGSFENFQPREKALEIIEHFGGRKVTSVSSKTTHLLAGESGGSKLDKAAELGITIVTENDFLSLLKANGLDTKGNRI